MFEPDKGVNIYNGVLQCKQLIREQNLEEKQMLFNDIILTVNKDSYVGDILMIYELKRALKITK